MDKEKAIVIDIDGVLLDSDPILKEIYNLLRCLSSILIARVIVTILTILSQLDNELHTHMKHFIL